MPDSLPPKKISDLTLERFALRELPGKEIREIERRLASDPVLRERLRVFEESNATILRETSPEIFARRLQALARKRGAEASVGSWSFTMWKPLLGSLALLMVLAIPIGLLRPRDTTPHPAIDGANGTRKTEPARPASPVISLPAVVKTPAVAETQPTSTEETVRLKGLEPHLALFRKTDGGAKPVRPGEKAHPGEVLRIGYQAAGFSFGAILSVDGNGSVTRHWPAAGARAGRLEKGDALLPSSFELDAAPDFERFFFVVSEEPFELEPLLESLRKTESLPESDKRAGMEKMRIVRFEVLKENRDNLENRDHGI